MVLVPFQGFLTVFGAHLFGHYTAFRLWDEVVLLLIMISSLFLLITDEKIRLKTLYRRLVWLIFAYILLTIILGVINYLNHGLTLKALGYGLIVDLRYPAFFLVTWTLSLRLSKLHNLWPKVVIWPACVVIVFGLLQIFILPHDFLKVFGYGPSTIPVEETINSNANYFRIASTLRGANPLGAYLIVPISLVFSLMLRSKKLNWRHVLFLLSAAVVLFFTFSRSAWLGVLISLAFIFLSSSWAHRFKKQIAIALGVLAVLITIVFIGFRHNHTFQNYVFHTQTNSKIKTTSDQQHALALKNGLLTVAHQPLGKGPGSAGPASLYNNHKMRNPENYYIQIAEEDGWIGISLFIIINVAIGYILWLRRQDPLALFLLASLIGISVVNLFLYAWSDDTLAYLWWGLAGIAMTNKISKPRKINHELNP